MSIATEITRIQNNIASAYSKCEEKGATMPTTQNSANLADTIDSIEAGGGSSPLPSGYTLKEWIQSDGVSYIDTNLSYMSDFNRIETKIIGGTDYPTGSSRTYLYGNGRDGSNSGIYLTIIGGIFYSINNSWSALSTGILCNEGEEYLITHANAGLMINDTATTFLAPNTRADKFKIFCTQSMPRDQYSKMKEMILFNGTTKVAHFLPCLNINNEPGLYDTERGIFLGNSISSGSLIVG